MKNLILIPVAILGLGLLLSCCKKKPEAEHEETTAAAGEEEGPEEIEAESEREAQKQEAAEPEATGVEEAAQGDPEKDCGALYDFMKGMIAQMEKKLGAAKGGKGATKKELPAKDTFIEACKELPSEVVRCMNPEVGLKEAARCQEILKSADPEKIKKFKEMMK